MLFVHVSGGLEVWIGVGCPCPPVRNDIVTPRNLLHIFALAHMLGLARLGFFLTAPSHTNATWVTVYPALFPFAVRSVTES